MNTSDFTAIVLARGGSKRVKDKNIKLLNGAPLIYWILDAAIEVFEQVIVATDSAKIKATVKHYPSDKISICDRDTVADKETSTDAIMKLRAGLNLDKFVLLQATSPLTTAEDIKSCIRLYQQGGCDSVVSGVTQYRRHHYRGLCERSERNISVVNGAIMVSSIGTILRWGYIAGGKSWFYEMPQDTYYEINTQEEFEICELLLKRRLQNEKT